MNIRTAFTPDEIAAYVEANKPDHPTAKGIAGFPPRYVELEMILNQIEQAEDEWRYHGNCEVESKTELHWSYSVQMGMLWRERMEEIERLIAGQEGGKQ